MHDQRNDQNHDRLGDGCSQIGWRSFLACLFNGFFNLGCPNAGLRHFCPDWNRIFWRNGQQMEAIQHNDGQIGIVSVDIYIWRVFRFYGILKLTINVFCTLFRLKFSGTADLKQLVSVDDHGRFSSVFLSDRLSKPQQRTNDDT